MVEKGSGGSSRRPSSGAVIPIGREQNEEVGDVDDGIAVGVTIALLRTVGLGTRDPLARERTTGLKALGEAGEDTFPTDAARAHGKALAFIGNAIGRIGIDRAVQDFADIGRTVAVAVTQRLALVRGAVGVTVLGLTIGEIAFIRDPVGIAVRGRSVAEVDGVVDSVAVAIGREAGIALIATIRNTVSIQILEGSIENLSVVDDAVIVAIRGPFDDIWFECDGSVGVDMYSVVPFPITAVGSVFLKRVIGKSVVVRASSIPIGVDPWLVTRPSPSTIRFGIVFDIVDVLPCADPTGVSIELFISPGILIG